MFFKSLSKQLAEKYPNYQQYTEVCIKQNIKPIGVKEHSMLHSAHTEVAGIRG